MAPTRNKKKTSRAPVDLTQDHHDSDESDKKKPEFIAFKNEEPVVDERKPAALAIAGKPKRRSKRLASPKKEDAAAFTDEDDRKLPALPAAKRRTKRRNPVKKENDDDEPPRKRAAKAITIDEDFTCAICLSDDIADTTNQVYSLTACGHSFCLVCLEGLVQTTASQPGSTVTSIPCPMGPKDCLNTLSQRDVQSILQYSPKTLLMYNEACSMAFLEDQVAQGNARRCPSEHCNYTFEYEADDTVPAVAASSKSKAKVFPNGCYFKCPECNSTYCLDCGANKGKVGPSHNGSCQDRVQELKDKANERQKLTAWTKLNAQADERFRKMMEREAKSGKTRLRPKCKRAITKNQGCDHMHCTGCGRHFNWSQAPRYNGESIPKKAKGK